MLHVRVALTFSAVAECCFLPAVAETTASASSAAADSPSLPSGAPTSAMEEIVVTAQKRSERLSSVPMSITAATGDQLATAGGNRPFPVGEDRARLHLSAQSVWDAGGSVFVESVSSIRLEQLRRQMFGHNVTNKYYWINVEHAIDTVAKYAGMPATYGVTVLYRFQ